MNTRPVRKWFFILAAVGGLSMAGLFLGVPWIWREVPTMRGVMLPIIAKTSKSWHGMRQADLMRKLGIPNSRDSSITMNAMDRTGSFYYLPLVLDQSFPEKDSKAFEELLTTNNSEKLSMDLKFALFVDLAKLGNIEDFRCHFSELKAIHNNLYFDEQWTYDLGEGDFGRAIVVHFNESRNLKNLEVIHKDRVSKSSVLGSPRFFDLKLNRVR